MNLTSTSGFVQRKDRERNVLINFEVFGKEHGNDWATLESDSGTGVPVTKAELFLQSFQKYLILPGFLGDSS